MIRQFCDLCDEQIQTDDREFTLKLWENTDSLYDRRDFRMDDGQFEATVQNYPLICVRCAMDVVKVIHEKKSR